jgi:micrococcal nuclease
MRTQTLTYACVAAALLLAALARSAPPLPTRSKVVGEFSGKVIGVADGDTVKVLVGKETVTVRLEGIDAPELGQSYGREAKLALARSVTGKTVTVKQTGTDKFGRTLGVVMVNGVDINAKLVEDGWAWHFQPVNDEQRLARLEDAARRAKRGLWGDNHPLSPWEYRARQAKSLPAHEKSANSPTTFWLNTSSGVRHNQRCEHFQKTKQGRFCGPTEGKPCRLCGG